jgi:membrane-associated protease RseP (regulator of RpoE activity)
VNLCSPFVREHRLVERARKRPAGTPNTLAGSEKEFFAQTSVRGKLQAFTLGRTTLAQVPTNLMVATRGGYASTHFNGVVGEGVLKRFTTVYDYSRGTMTITPNADFAGPFKPRRTFGATFLSDGPDYTVFKVTGIRKDSPADSAGLKTGDIVVAVDDKPAAQLRLAALRALLADEGSHHALDVKRGDAAPIRIDVIVRLMSIDEP